MSRKLQLLFLCALILLFVGPVSSIAGNELPVSSPFFRPYEGDFSIEMGVGYKAQSSRLTIPALDSARETMSKEASTGVALNYGVTEYFSIGVSGKFMADQDYSLIQSGPAFAGNPGSNSRNQGFYDAGVQLGLRMLGTRTDEWFVNLDMGFLPGLADANNFLFSWPHNQYLAGITLGRNIEAWSFGILSAMQYYAPSALDKSDEKNNQLLSNSQLFVQVDFASLYVRTSAGVVKFLDSRSNENALKKKIFPTGQVEMGFPFTDTCVLSARLSYVAGAQGEMTVAGFNAFLVAQPIWMGSVSVVVAF